MQEHEFILNYARTDPSSTHLWGEDLWEGFNWHYIFTQARYHNVAPLLYNNIKNLPVPEAVLKEFEETYTYTAFHNMLYLEELKKITDKVNVIVLKGPMLAQEIYGNIALRPFNDMDILVKREDVDEIKNFLYRLGYSTRNTSFYKRYHFHMPFIKMARIPIHIELHWAFVDKFILNRIDMEMVWKDAIGNKLSPEINIIYLLLHIEKHAFFNKAIYKDGNPRDWIFTRPCGNQLIWYTDIYETMKKITIDLGRLIDLSKEWKVQNLLFYNLYILNKLYPIPSLGNLPQPELGLLKRSVYKFALKRADFRLEPDMQLRPIRAVDLLNYLFPSSDYNCIIQFFTGLMEVIKEFFGVWRIRFTRKRKGFQSVD